MPTPAPEGIIEVQQHSLRALIAATAEWQAWTEAVDAAQARLRIHDWDLPKPDSEDGTYAQDELKLLSPAIYTKIWHPESGAGGRPLFIPRAGIGAFASKSKWIVNVSQWLERHDAEDYRSALSTFSRRLGKLIEQIAALSDDTAYLTITDTNLVGLPIAAIELWSGPDRLDSVGTTGQGDKIEAELLVYIGDGAV